MPFLALCLFLPLFVMDEETPAVDLQVFGNAITKSLDRIALDLPDLTDEPRDPYSSTHSYRYSKELHEAGSMPFLVEIANGSMIHAT